MCPYCGCFSPSGRRNAVDYGDDTCPLCCDVHWYKLSPLCVTATTAVRTQVEVGGFPTLFFFPGKSKDSPMQYQGARETEDLAKFIMDNVRSNDDVTAVDVVVAAVIGVAVLCTAAAFLDKWVLS